MFEKRREGKCRALAAPKWNCRHAQGCLRGGKLPPTPETPSEWQTKHILSSLLLHFLCILEVSTNLLNPIFPRTSTKTLLLWCWQAGTVPSTLSDQQPWLCGWNKAVFTWFFLDSGAGLFIGSIQIVIRSNPPPRAQAPLDDIELHHLQGCNIYFAVSRYLDVVVDGFRQGLLGERVVFQPRKTVNIKQWTCYKVDGWGVIIQWDYNIIKSLIRTLMHSNSRFLCPCTSS